MVNVPQILSSQKIQNLVLFLFFFKKENAAKRFLFAQIVLDLLFFVVFQQLMPMWVFFVFVFVNLPLG